MIVFRIFHALILFPFYLVFSHQDAKVNRRG